MQRPLDLEAVQVVVQDTRATMASIAARFNGDPTAELRVAGITGTNGKTTTAYLLRSILEGSGIQTGLLGTVQRVVGAVASKVVRTTPEAIDLQADFRAMLDAGDRACAMEVSSHALALGRSDAVHFATAVFTNLTQDHLDFHDGMEDYFAAKRLLFEPRAGERPGSSIVNVDDPYGARLASGLDCTTVSALGAEADFRALGVSFDESGSRFRCLTPEGELEVSIRLPGEFNVQNALCALAAAVALGVSFESAVAALAEAEPVPGRFEPIDGGQEFTVLVDYAHTPDSLDNVLRAARRITSGRLICVFGCGGDRDRAKRPLMGEIAASLADLAVVTSDNPRTEDPGAIIAEILAGMPDPSAKGQRRARPSCGHRRSPSRAAQGADTVVIAGKGHEVGQDFGGGRVVPFDDREVAREVARGAPSLRSSRVIGFDGRRLADEAGAQVVAAGPQGTPARAVVDSRLVGEGDLFVGFPGKTSTEASSPRPPCEAGAWGVLVGPRGGPEHHGDRPAGSSALRTRCSPFSGSLPPGAASLAVTSSGSPDRRARHRSRTSAAPSCLGRCTPAPRTSTPRSACRWRCWPLRARTDVLVLEMGMRGPGQIAELCAIAEPDVGAITNVGPVHLELLGSLEAIAAAKAEILAGLRPGGRGVVPAELGLLEPHLERGSDTISFGPQGDVYAVEAVVSGGETHAVIATPLGQVGFRFPFTEAHNLSNALCAIAIGIALGSELAELAEQDVADSLLAAERRAPRACRRGGGYQRLLQRQPDLHARRPRPSQLTRRDGKPDCGSRRNARTWAPRPPPSTAMSPPTRDESASTRSWASASWPANTRRTNGSRLLKTPSPSPTV